MRLKGRDYREVRRWKKIQELFGYLPHFRRVGRVLVEVRFLLHPADRRWWVVICVASGAVMIFYRNGTPLGTSRGRLVGPLIEKRKVKK